MYLWAKSVTGSFVFKWCFTIVRMNMRVRTSLLLVMYAAFNRLWFCLVCVPLYAYIVVCPFYTVCQHVLCQYCSSFAILQSFWWHVYVYLSFLSSEEFLSCCSVSCIVHYYAVPLVCWWYNHHDVLSSVWLLCDCVKTSTWSMLGVRSHIVYTPLLTVDRHPLWNTDD